MAALFTIMKIWKYSKGQSTDCGIYILQNTTQPQKMYEILLFAVMWMDQENIMLREISQK